MTSDGPGAFSCKRKESRPLTKGSLARHAHAPLQQRTPSGELKASDHRVYRHNVFNQERKRPLFKLFS